MKNSALLLLIGCAYAQIAQTNPLPEMPQTNRLPQTTFEFRFKNFLQVTDNYTAKKEAQSIPDWVAPHVVLAHVSALNRKNMHNPR